MITESELDAVERCLQVASRINPDSPRRKTLRTILARHDLEVAEALIAYRRGQQAVYRPPTERKE